MPIVRGPQTDVYIHDKYPMMIQPDETGLACAMIIFIPGQVVKVELKGRLEALAKQFMENTNPSPIL